MIAINNERNEITWQSAFVAMLPERNVRTGFAEANHIEGICRHLPKDEGEVVRFMFITGWRSNTEALPLTRLPKSLKCSYRPASSVRTSGERFASASA